MDVTPTVISLLELSSKDPIPREGQDLLPLLRGEQCGESAVVSSTVGARFVEDPPLDQAVRFSGYKEIRTGSGQQMCFDLQADPGENHDVSNQYPDRVKELQAHVDEHLRRVTQTRPDKIAATPTPDEEVIARLRDLGYVE